MLFVVLDVKQGTFVVATDFDLSLPDELAADGLSEFRRHKGCKRRNCTLDNDDAAVVTTTPLPGRRRRKGGRRHHRVRV